MNVLELRNELLDMILGFRKEEQLVRLHKVAQEISEENSAEELEALLSEEQIVRLKKNIAHSRTASDLIDHEDVKKKYAQWFNK